MPPITYVISNKVIVTKDNDRKSTLVFSGRTGIIKRLPDWFWLKLLDEQKNGGEIQLCSALLPLVETEIMIPKGEDETSEIINRITKAINSTPELYWVIMPSADCNLQCTYCGQKHSKEQLSHKLCDVVLNTLGNTLEAYHYTDLSIGWYGGEPLLGLEVIRYLTPRFLNICKIFGITFEAKLATNGTLLTPNITHELVDKLGINKIEITIDGPKDVHNIRRISRQKKGTYDVILKNLSELKFSRKDTLGHVQITIRCNVDSRNFDAIKHMIDSLVCLLDLGLHLNLYFAPVFSWGETSDQKFSFNKEEFAIHEIEFIRYAIEKGFSCALISQPERFLCIHGMPNSILVAPNGHLYNCTEIALVPAYEEDVTSSRWDEGSLSIYSEKRGEIICKKHPWNQYLLKDNKYCADCEILGICGGGCPKQWHEGRSGCPSFKFNIAGRMKLFSKLHGDKLDIPGLEYV